MYNGHSSFTLIASGRLSQAIGFAISHPALAWDSVTLSASAVGAQWFSYSHVVEFGALVFAATLNVRQVISILISYAKYGHTITPLQILGLLTVLAALFSKSISGLKESPKTKGEERIPWLSADDGPRPCSLTSPVLPLSSTHRVGLSPKR